MTTRSEPKVSWRIPVQAVIGALLIIAVELLIGGAALLWSTMAIGLGGEMSAPDGLVYATIALALIPLVLIVYGLIRRRLGPMRLGALLSVIPAVIALFQPSDNFYVLIGLVAATVIGALLIFTAKRPTSVVYR